MEWLVFSLWKRRAGCPNGRAGREEERENFSFHPSIVFPQRTIDWISLKRLAAQRGCLGRHSAIQLFFASSSLHQWIDGRERGPLKEELIAPFSFFVDSFINCFLSLAVCSLWRSHWRCSAHNPPIKPARRKQTIHSSKSGSALGVQWNEIPSNQTSWLIPFISSPLRGPSFSPIHQTIIPSILKERNEMFDWIWRWSGPACTLVPFRKNKLIDFIQNKFSFHQFISLCLKVLTYKLTVIILFDSFHSSINWRMKENKKKI